MKIATSILALIAFVAIFMTILTEARFRLGGARSKKYTEEQRECQYHKKMYSSCRSKCLTIARMTPWCPHGKKAYVCARSKKMLQFNKKQKDEGCIRKCKTDHPASQYCSSGKGSGKVSLYDEADESVGSPWGSGQSGRGPSNFDPSQGWWDEADESVGSPLCYKPPYYSCNHQGVPYN